MRDAFPALGIEDRIGITTGEVVTGTEECTATGDAVTSPPASSKAAHRCTSAPT
jgi:hypothetical protein